MSDADDRKDKRDQHGGGGSHQSSPATVSGRDEIDPDAPPSAEEVAASQRLRDALEGKPVDDPSGSVQDDVLLAKSLRAAWSPDTIDAGVHAEMLDELPTEEELVLAAELRDALEAASAPAGATSIKKKSKSNDDVVIALLRSAWSPSALSETEHRAIIARAIGEPAAAAQQKVVSITAARTQTRTMRLVVVTTTSVLALAASIVVWIGTAPTSNGGGEAPLAKARSTQPLFDEPFKAGETSARIDKIAMARSSDYRDNRFAKWGVR